MNFANQSKLERAQKVVAHPELFHSEAVEIKALGIVNASGKKLSDEKKVVEVYKIIGGKILDEKPAGKVKAEKPAGKDKDEEEGEEEAE